MRSKLQNYAFYTDWNIVLKGRFGLFEIGFIQAGCYLQKVGIFAENKAIVVFQLKWRVGVKGKEL